MVAIAIIIKKIHVTMCPCIQRLNDPVILVENPARSIQRIVYIVHSMLHSAIRPRGAQKLQPTISATMAKITTARTPPAMINQSEIVSWRGQSSGWKSVSS
jgi:hypothetical protein